jgi:hypothetical protein
LSSSDNYSYPMPQESRLQHYIRTHWVPAVVYLAAAAMLIAVVRGIGI